MSYLKDIEQLDQEEQRDESLIQRTLFGEVIEDSIGDILYECPICRRNRIYRNWWTCKWCGKHVPAKEYTRQLINHFSNICLTERS